MDQNVGYIPILLFTEIFWPLFNLFYVGSIYCKLRFHRSLVEPSSWNNPSRTRAFSLCFHPGCLGVVLRIQFDCSLSVTCWPSGGMRIEVTDRTGRDIVAPATCSFCGSTFHHRLRRSPHMVWRRPLLHSPLLGELK